MCVREKACCNFAVVALILASAQSLETNVAGGSHSRSAVRVCVNKETDPVNREQSDQPGWILWASKCRSWTEKETTEGGLSSLKGKISGWTIMCTTMIADSPTVGNFYCISESN